MTRAPARGSATIEAVLLAPIMMAFVMLVVHVHRQTDASITVSRAADAGARAASMSGPRTMRVNGVTAARRELESAMGTCSRVGVDVAKSESGGLTSVSVTVTCETSKRGLGLLGIASGRITRTSTEVVDYYTGR